MFYTCIIQVRIKSYYYWFVYSLNVVALFYLNSIFLLSVLFMCRLQNYKFSVSSPAGYTLLIFFDISNFVSILHTYNFLASVCTWPLCDFGLYFLVLSLNCLRVVNILLIAYNVLISTGWSILLYMLLIRSLKFDFGGEYFINFTKSNYYHGTM